MREEFEVAIVGAGPAGISAALALAEKGIRVIVFERGEFPGAKNVSGGVLYGHDLAESVPDFIRRECPVERNIVESRVWYLSLDGGFNVSFRDRAFEEGLSFNAFTVGRARFDRWFAGIAEEKGALVVCGTTVTDLLRDGGGRVTGVRTDRSDGDVTARVVLIADGVNSALAAKTGFRAEPEPNDVALAVKEIIELPEEVINERFNVEAGHGVTIEILGEITQGMDGVAVIYTNKNSLSLCIGANLFDLMSNTVRPYEMLEEFKAHPMVAPLIKSGRPREYMAHWLAEGGYDTIPHIYGDGYLIAGESGMLFNALHREGSNMAMASGRLAALTIAGALARGDTGSESLAGYAAALQASYVMKDLKKYRRFNRFLLNHKELFSTLPRLGASAAREMLTVDGISKKEKQTSIRRRIQGAIPLARLARLLWAGARSIG